MKNIKLLFVLILLVSFFGGTVAVSAREGSRAKQCIDMPTEDEKNVCLYYLELSAQEHCADKADGEEKEACKTTYKNSLIIPGGVSNPNPDDNCVGDNPAKCTITDMLKDVMNVLAGAVGIVIVIMVVWGGIQYTSSRDNPQLAASAKEHIRNALLALIIYLFAVAFLNWIVPGGVFAP